MIIPLITAACILVAALPCFAQHDRELQDLQIADQTDRAALSGKPWTNEQVAKDKVRRLRAMQILKEGRIRSGIDYSNAALIFQHGETPDDYRLAYSLAWTAYTMLDDGPQRRYAGWLASAAWDRLLLSLGHKQWYGTQYRRTMSGTGEQLPTDDEALSQEEKQRFSSRNIYAP